MKDDQKKSYGLTTPLITLALVPKWVKLKMELFGWIKNFYLHMIIGNFGEILMIEMF